MADKNVRGLRGLKNLLFSSYKSRYCECTDGSALRLTYTKSYLQTRSWKRKQHTYSKRR